jgi:hypothetical protein
MRGENDKSGQKNQNVQKNEKKIEGKKLAEKDDSTSTSNVKLFNR